MRESHPIQPTRLNIVPCNASTCKLGLDCHHTFAILNVSLHFKYKQLNFKIKKKILLFL